MKKKYYLDACIWRDYFENRSDKFRPLGEWAFELIKIIIENEDFFIISDLLIDELRKEYSDEEIKYNLNFIPEKLIINLKEKESTSKEAFELKQKSGIHFADALHFVLARSVGAVLVTRDRHFDELNSEYVKKPEDLI
jgi:predicted nucleic acid-binding protein